MQDHNIVNQAVYADLQNSSFIPYYVEIKDDEIWLTKNEGFFAEQVPYNLSICGDNLIACYVNGFESFSVQDGTKLWSREIINHSDYYLNKNGITIINSNLYHQFLDCNGKLGNKLSLPFLANYVHLIHALFFNDTILFVFNRFGGPDIPPEKNGFVINLYNKIDHKILWWYSGEENINRYSVSEDKSTLYLSTGTNLYIVSTDEKLNINVNTLSLTSIESISLYNDKILIVEKGEIGLKLKAIENNGNLAWSVDLPGISKLYQPPAVTLDRVIYCAGSRALINISDGKIIWSKELFPAPDDIFLTALADNSVLVASLNTITHYSSEGEIINNITNPFIITCRPIIDKNGKLYIAGKGWLRCIK